MFVENTANDTFFVHPSACVDENVQIGEGTKIWHFCHISQDASIGEHCSVGQNVFVAPGVKIGNFCKIQNNVSVYDGVELGDYVFCGPSMVFTNVQRPRCKYPQAGHQFYLKTPVCEGASIGANATIVCGHRIGRHAFIAARKRGHKGCARSCHHDGRPGQTARDGPANVGKRWMKRSAAPSAAESIAKVRTALRR